MAADECNIKVICRVRPLNAAEERSGSQSIVKFPTEDTVSVAVSLAGCSQTIDYARLNPFKRYYRLACRIVICVHYRYSVITEYCILSAIITEHTY